MSLKMAYLTYGVSSYKVTRSEYLPLPTRFDFDNPVECAKTIFAIMSNASGGHILRECKLLIDPKTKSANLTANGCHVFYEGNGSDPFPSGSSDTVIEQWIRDRDERTIRYELGSVRTDQYGDGWKRAVWEGE